MKNTFDIRQYRNVQSAIGYMENSQVDPNTGKFIDSRLKTNNFTQEELLRYKAAKKIFSKYNKLERILSIIPEEFTDYMNEFYEKLSKNPKEALIGKWDSKYYKSFNDEIMAYIYAQRNAVFQKWAENNNLKFDDQWKYLKHLAEEEKSGQKSINNSKNINKKYKTIKGPKLKQKVTETNLNQKIFYHGGIESNFSYDKLDLLRASEKQGSKYAGFYMYGEENLEGAMKYAQQENSLKKTNTKGVAKISLDDNLKIYEKTDFGGITRIKPEELKTLQEQGYDMISGKMMGKTEYVLLNKNKISSIEFMPLDGSDPISIYSRDVSNNIEKLTVKEAFDKYGPNSDEFYTSQGLDPVQQREKIEKLNSNRKSFDNTPVETKEFNQKLKNLGITEEEYYKQFNESLKSKKYKTKKGPKLKQKLTFDEKTLKEFILKNPEMDSILDNVGDDFYEYLKIFSKTQDPRKAYEIWEQKHQTIENNKPKNKKYKATKGPKVKPKAQKTNELILKEQLEQSAKEVAEKNTKQVSKASSLPKKSLSGGGKMAIGIAVAGLIIGGALASNNNNSSKKQKNKKPHSLPRSTNTEEIDNGYAMQMAQDISSYRYGKHMTGFVNY